MNSTFLQRFKTYIDNESLIKSGDKVILAVSGGYDSIVLLDLFISIRLWYDLKLVIAHVNHSLRGENADRDEKFVKKISLKYRVKFFSKKLDVKRYAKSNKLSIEQAARDLRFNYLDSLRKKIDYNKIALGHHADDWAETIIMNLIRGFGIKGLRGIKPVSNNFIHPLLFATKQEIIAYAESKKLDHVEDESNKDKTFFRNKIRHDILSVMTKQFGDQTIQSICRSGRILNEIEEYIMNSTNAALKNVIVSDTDKEIVLDINKFLDYFIAIKKSIIINLLEKMCVQYTYSNIESVLKLIENGRSGGRIEINNDTIVVKYSNNVYFTKKQRNINETELHIGKWNFIPDSNIKIRLNHVNKIHKVKHKDKYVEYVDYDNIELPLRVRSWIKGDKFTPLGMTGTKKLHDFFIDEGIVNFKRQLIPILVDKLHIVWIIGYRINENFKITKKTNNILKLEVKKI